MFGVRQKIDFENDCLCESCLRNTIQKKLNNHNFYTKNTEGIARKHMTTNRFAKLLTISVDNSVDNVLCNPLTT